ncbi:MAG: F-box protein [Verrucomicrobia bacterium]|nr:F-box protein [Verrucomicrobiota bacterium]
MQGPNLALSTYVFPGAEEIIRQHHLIHKLPNEILCRIFQILGKDVRNLHPIPFVCRRWREVVYMNEVGYLKEISKIRLFLSPATIRRQQLDNPYVNRREAAKALEPFTTPEIGQSIARSDREADL